jgi:hypothetical protein
MTTCQISISALAKDIRECEESLAIVHDDYTCVSKWADMAGYWITTEEFKPAEGHTLSELMNSFLKGIFRKRKEILDNEVKQATIAFKEMKAFLIKVSKDDQTLQDCANLSPDDSGVLAYIDDFKALSAALNGYYVANATSNPKAVEYFSSLSQSLMQAICLIEEGKVVPLETFKGDTSQFDQNVHKFSVIFAAVKPDTRRAIVDHIYRFMYHAFRCFIYYRLPVNVIKGQPPIFFSRFMSAVKFTPFLKKFRVEFSECVL